MKTPVIIKTPAQLMRLALARRSVSGFHSHTNRPMPAAFLVSMQFRTIMGLISRRRLSVYEKTTTKTK